MGNTAWEQLPGSANVNVNIEASWRWPLGPHFPLPIRVTPVARAAIALRPAIILPSARFSRLEASNGSPVRPSRSVAQPFRSSIFKRQITSWEVLDLFLRYSTLSAMPWEIPCFSREAPTCACVKQHQAQIWHPPRRRCFCTSSVDFSLPSQYSFLKLLEPS
jgi:hypothetical protein